MSEPNARPLAKAKAPVKPGMITVLGVLLALVVIAVGVVGLRDALLSAGALHGRSWLERGIDALDGMKPQWWVVPVGIAALLVGVWMLAVAVRPRPRTAIRLRSETGVFLRPRDVKKLASLAVDDVDGVLSARISATRRLTQLSVSVTGDDDKIVEDVRAALTQRLSALAPPPRLKIKPRIGVAP